MKKIILLLLIINFLNTKTADSKNIRASLLYATFNSPDKGPYFETYLSINANTVCFVKNKNGKFQGTIELTIIFKQDSIVKNFNKINLLSPEVDDTANINFNFIDQQRFLLKNGSYNMEISVVDKNSNNKPVNITEPVDINYPSDKIMFSSIQLVESYKKTENENILSKSGYDLVPYINNFYPETMNSLAFYTEIYNTKEVLGEGEQYITRYYIKSFESGNILNDFVNQKKETANTVNVLFNEFDISKLPSGNYTLNVEIIDKTNKVVADRESFFQKSNPSLKFNIKDIQFLDITNTFATKYSNKGTLAEYIRSLCPISTQIELNFADNLLKKDNLQKTDLKIMQQYFYNFWTNRNKLYPEDAWMAYLENVKKVQTLYGTKIQKGYKTDRGRVYLQYGAPNAIVSETVNPSEYPYEIWHYYQLNNQRNRKFVFFTRELAVNDYILIHSDALGEIYDYKWHKLISRVHDRAYIDDSNDNRAPSNNSNFGSHPADYYILPR